MKLTTLTTAAGSALLASVVTFLFMSPGNRLPQPAPVAADTVQYDRLYEEIAALRQQLDSMNVPARLDNGSPAPVNGTAGDGTVAQTGDTTPESVPKMVMVNPTPEQNQVFEELKARFDNPGFVETLSLNALVQSEEMSMLPEPLQMVIISRAIEKFNQGEVDKDMFLGD